VTNKIESFAANAAASAFVYHRKVCNKDTGAEVNGGGGGERQDVCIVVRRTGVGSGEEYWWWFSQRAYR